MRTMMLLFLAAAGSGWVRASTTLLEATLGTPVLTAADGTAATVLRGRAFLKAEGSQVHYSLWLQFSDQSTAAFVLEVDGGSHGFNTGQWRETTVVGGEALRPSNPFVIATTNPFLISPGSPINLESWSTISLPTQADYRVFEGVIDDLLLAQALMGAERSTIRVDLTGGVQAGGAFFASTPEPARGLLTLAGGVWLVLRRRRAALGAG